MTVAKSPSTANGARPGPGTHSRRTRSGPSGMTGTPPRRPHVVIVGAGFGGLTAARELADAPVDITLVDRRNHHLFQPLLYQVATAGLEPAEIAWPIRAVLARQTNATVLMDEVTGLDVEHREVRCAEHSPLPYDELILATGARHAYFGNNEWERYAPGLKTAEDAIDLRRRILTAFERAENTADPAARQRLLTFVVVGAGPTGVELAGALAELAHHSLSANFRRVDPGQARIMLIEAGPRILAPFAESLSRYAHMALQRLGVEVRVDTTVTRCDADGVIFGDTRMPAGTVIWAAGVQASAVAGWLDAPTDDSGRVRVQEDLSLSAHPEVHVIGDTAAVTDANGQPVPGIAPAAKQQGRYVANRIKAAAVGKRKAKPFRYRHYGNLATIGRHAAIIELGRLRLKGRLAWWLWGIAHIYFLIGVRAPMMVAMEWLWSYITAGKGARLILGNRHCRRSAHPKGDG